MLWAVLRALGTVGLGMAGGSMVMAPAVYLVGTPWVVLVLLAAVWFDTERRGEAVFLANLGYGFRRLALAVTAAVVALDAAVAAALTLAGALRG